MGLCCISVFWNQTLLCEIESGHALRGLVVFACFLLLLFPYCSVLSGIFLGQYMAGWLMSRLCMWCCDGDASFGVCFWFTWSLFSCSRLAVRPFGGIFDTPVDVLFCRGFDGVSGMPGCVESDCAVSLSFAAARRVVPRLGCFEVGEWWWFENSRAYLYYFFIVNDCQSVLRPARVFRVWVPGGRSNGTGFLRTVRFPDKRMSVSLFLRVTCWFSS